MRKPYLYLVVSLLLVISIGILKAQQLPDTPVDGNIVGGSETTIEQYPFQVAIYVDGIFQGGGVIIKDNTVLTAAHVVNRFDPSSHNITAVSGVTSISTDFGPDRQEKRVGSYLIHPQYINSRSGCDIAILYLDTPFAINQKTKTIRIPSTTDLQYIQPGVIAEVSGWGYTDKASETLPLNLMRLESSILGNDDGRLSTIWGLPINETILYTYLTPGSTYFKGTCNYDSGGPLIVRTCNGEALLAGLVSFAFSNCLQGPSGFLRISSVRYWIAYNTGINRDISLTTSPYSSLQTICATGATMQVGNLEPGYTVSWAVGNSRLYVQNTSGLGNNTATLYPTGSSNGWATVSAVVHSVCGIYATLEKQVWVGNPGLASIQAQYMSNYDYNSICGRTPIQFATSGNDGAFTYNWQVTFGDAYIQTDEGTYVTIISPPPGQYFGLAVTSYNPCGMTTNYSSWSTTSMIGGYNCIDYGDVGLLSLYPNPTTGMLNIDMGGNPSRNSEEDWERGTFDELPTTTDRKDNTNGVSLVVGPQVGEETGIMGMKEVTLSRQNGEVVLRTTFDGDDTDLDLSRFENGSYILTIKYGGHIKAERIIISK